MSITNESAIRQEFEKWFEAWAMPCESDWFRRDPLDSDDYDNSTVSHAWEGFKAGYEKCRQHQKT